MTTSQKQFDAEKVYPITVDYGRSLADMLVSTHPSKAPSPRMSPRSRGNGPSRGAARQSA
jgi:hypothetical protein